MTTSAEETVYASGVRASIRVALASSLIAVAAASGAHAEPSFIVLDAPSSCAVTPAVLEERVTEALVGRRAAELSARVTFEEAEGGYQATLGIERGTLRLGTSIITAPTCDEALEAAALALALALGEREPTASELDVPEQGVLPVQQRSRVRWLTPHRAAAGGDTLSTAGAPRRASESDWRVSLMTGLDAGTLAEATPFAAARVALVEGRLELRAAVRYGLPRIEEQADGAGTASTRREFGAVDAGACYGLGGEFRFSACGGGELGVTRHVERWRTQQVESDQDDVRPRVSGVVRALFAHRAGLVQPELELAGLAVAVGRPDDARWLAIRVAAGAAVQF